MSFNSMFCKIWIIAQYLGITGCKPRNFQELKCLINTMVDTVSIREYEQGGLRELEQGGDYLSFE
jgi:hypothetical protein